jgi:hypothetical protein
VELNNYGDADLSIGSISITGTAATDFSQTNNCPAVLTAGSNCAVTVTFAPTVNAGVRTANLAFDFGASAAAQTVPLTGSAGSPGFSLPTSVDFGSAPVGGIPNNPLFSRTVDIVSFGSAPVVFTSGSTLGDFSFDVPLGDPIFPITVPSGQTDHLPLKFAPTAAGTRTGSLVLVDSSGNHFQVPLQGTGLTADFGLTSNGPASITIVAGQTAAYSVGLVSGSSFTGTLNLSCSGVPPGGTCSVNPNTASVTPSSAVIVAVQVGTTARKTASLKRLPRSVWWSLAMVLGIAIWRPRKLKGQKLLLVVTMLALGTLVACGGGGGGNGGGGTGTPPGTYSLTVTAQSGSGSHTMNLTLMVQ